jgi:hypothetical protein
MGVGDPSHLVANQIDECIQRKQSGRNKLRSPTDMNTLRFGLVCLSATVREYKSASESAAGTMENEWPSMVANALEAGHRG